MRARPQDPAARRAALDAMGAVAASGKRPYVAAQKVASRVTVGGGASGGASGAVWSAPCRAPAAPPARASLPQEQPPQAGRLWPWRARGAPPPLRSSDRQREDASAS